MTYAVIIECHQKTVASYTSDFIPRVGDTIVNRDNNIPLTVTDVVYFIPCTGETSMSVVVRTTWWMPAS